jgi:hypothetical protein
MCLERVGTDGCQTHIFSASTSREATQSRMQTCHKQRTPRVESRENVTRQNLAPCIHHALHHCELPAVILKKVPITTWKSLINPLLHDQCLLSSHSLSIVSATSRTMYNPPKMTSPSGHHYHHQQQSSRSDRCREIMSIDNLLTPQRGQLSVPIHKLQPASSQMPSPPVSESAFERTPREKREPYSDQAQFYIIYVRVGKEKDWNQIERSFEEVFGQHRAKDGLTAVYYRIRSKWGLPPVNKSSQEISEEGKDMIRQRAHGFDHGFLKRVGYFEWCQSYQSSAAPR